MLVRLPSLFPEPCHCCERTMALHGDFSLKGVSVMWECRNPDCYSKYWWTSFQTWWQLILSALKQVAITALLVAMFFGVYVTLYIFVG